MKPVPMQECALNPEEIQTQLTQIKQNIANIEAMLGFSAEQLQEMLAPLLETKAELEAQLSLITQSVGERGIVIMGIISWYQFIAFCRWLSQKLNLNIDFPYEQEWEWCHNKNYNPQITQIDSSEDWWVVRVGS